MKAYKKLMLLLLTPILFGYLGCKKYLDREPLGGATQDDISGGGLEGKVIGIYSQLYAWGVTQLPFLMIHSVRSDDADKGSAPTDGADSEAMYDNFAYAKDHWLLEPYWNDHFNFITLTNDAIQYADSLKLTEEPEAKIRIAEARFLRAYSYFDLVRTFGEVPKIDFKTYNVAQANIPKSSVTDIYALIDQDLDYAEQNLPPVWDAKFLGRITKGAATTLHAKTYLYRQNWATALAKAEEVINSGLYSLYPSFSGLFTEQAENKQESIFEIQNYENATGGVTYTNALAEYQGVRGSGTWDLGWGWNAPSDNLVNTGFEPGDPRKDATILKEGTNDGYGNIVPTGLARKYWNRKVYSDPARRAQTGDNKSHWVNTIIMRYADVLLMAAEASNELGNSTKALDYVEQVRARARGTNAGVLPKITTTDQVQLRDAIRRERRAEFAMEFERFFDLVRWGIAQQVLNAAGHPYQDRNKYMPIPQGVIDKSGGILIQNPDYP